MTDFQTWDAAVAALREELELLPVERKQFLVDVVGRIMSVKQRLGSMCDDVVDCATICKRCGGQCCLAGKFHFTAVDLLAFLLTEVPLFTPNFGSLPGCPYSSGAGCLMSPAYRPYNCITFICDEIEEGLNLEEKREFYLLADRLRDAYAEIEQSCGRRFMGGLLQTFERRPGQTGILGNHSGRTEERNQ